MASTNGINPTVLQGLRDLHILRQHIQPLLDRERELIDSITAGVALSGMGSVQIQQLLADRVQLTQ